MSPERRRQMAMRFAWRDQGGFSLPVVIFVLVALALMAAAMTRLIGGGAQSLAFEVVSTRAYFAAQSAQQWAAATALANPSGGCGAIAGHTLDFTGDGLVGCSAVLGCDPDAPADLLRADGDCNGHPLEDGKECRVNLLRIAALGQCGSGVAAANRDIRWLVRLEWPQ